MVTLLLAMAACEGTVVAGVTVVDSAGVQVTISEPADLVFAELDSVPALSLGSVDATGAMRFRGIQGMHVDGVGRIWVTHELVPELLIFESDGSHWKTRGGRGEAPGEFAYAQLLGNARGDSVLVVDLGLRRATVFDPDGELVRTERLPDTDGPVLQRPVGVFGDGSILAEAILQGAVGSFQAGEIFEDSVELVRIDVNASSIHPFLAVPGRRSMWNVHGRTGAVTSQGPVRMPFTTAPAFDVASEEVHLVSGPDFRVQLLEAGELRKVYGIARPPRAVTERQVEAYRDFVREYVPEELAADQLAALDHEARPSRLPAYDRVLLSSNGETWAQVYDPDLWAPHDWDVFDAEGRFLGRVHVENRFYPMVIDRQAVFGVWHDPRGFEHIRSYRLIRP